MLNPQAFFDALSDEIRRRILCLLLKEGELCVCELFQALDVHQPKVSRHLAVLRDAAVLAQRREGTWVFYRIDPQLPAWAYRLLVTMTEGIGTHAVSLEDAERLKKAATRPVRCAA